MSQKSSGNKLATRNKLDTRTDTAVGDLLEELEQARTKFPSNNHMLAVLQEEVGELAQALIDQDAGENVTDDEIYKEAIQTAAMALRVATEGDPSFKYDFSEEPAREKPARETTGPDGNRLAASMSWSDMTEAERVEYLLYHPTDVRKHDFNGVVKYQGLIGEVAVTGWVDLWKNASTRAKDLKAKIAEKGKVPRSVSPIEVFSLADGL